MARRATGGGAEAPDAEAAAAQGGRADSLTRPWRWCSATAIPKGAARVGTGAGGLRPAGLRPHRPSATGDHLIEAALSYPCCGSLNGGRTIVPL